MTTPLLPILTIHFDPVTRQIVKKVPAYQLYYGGADYLMTDSLPSPWFDISRVFTPADRVAYSQQKESNGNQDPQ